MHKTRFRWKNIVWMVKLFLFTPYRRIKGGDVQLSAVLTCALDGGEWKLYTPAALPPVKKYCVLWIGYRMDPRGNMDILEERKMFFLIGLSSLVTSRTFFTNCALPGVMLRNTFRTKAVICCIWQRKGMCCGLRCRENLDQLDYCHLLKAGGAGADVVIVEAWQMDAAGHCPRQQPTSAHGLWGAWGHSNFMKITTSINRL